MYAATDNLLRQHGRTLPSTRHLPCSFGQFTFPSQVPDLTLFNAFYPRSRNACHPAHMNVADRYKDIYGQINLTSIRSLPFISQHLTHETQQTAQFKKTDNVTLIARVQNAFPSCHISLTTDHFILFAAPPSFSSTFVDFPGSSLLPVE